MREKAAELISLKDRIEIFQLDPTEENEIESFHKEISDSLGDIYLFINCVGFLHGEQILPEKNVNQITADKLLYYFKVNTLVTPLFAKYFKSNLRHKNESYFVSLSAKVGSIEDNKIGGWYGYRSSKAALNMIMKNLAIEFSRYGSSCIFLSIHPGTTITDLSEPFIKNLFATTHS